MKRLIRSTNFEIAEDSKIDIEGMALVGRVSMKRDTYEVYVNTNDAGKIPHFHVRYAPDWSKFHTCVRLDVAEYFLHGDKQDTFNASQKKDLQKFMEGPVTVSRYRSKFDNNWELACFLWDMNNSEVCIDEDIKQPDYRNL